MKMLFVSQIQRELHHLKILTSKKLLTKKRDAVKGYFRFKVQEL